MEIFHVGFKAVSVLKRSRSDQKESPRLTVCDPASPEVVETHLPGLKGSFLVFVPLILSMKSMKRPKQTICWSDFQHVALSSKAPQTAAHCNFLWTIFSSGLIHICRWIPGTSGDSGLHQTSVTTVNS